MSQTNQDAGPGAIYSNEAEQSVLGALLADNKCFDVVTDIVSQGDFYVRDHGQIFHAIFELLGSGKAADVITVYEWLIARKVDIEDALPYLTSLVQNVPGSFNAANYARLVRERSLRRALVGAAQAIIHDAHAPNGREVETLVDEAQGRILAVAETQSRQGAEFAPIVVPMREAVLRIQELSERESDSDVIGLATGFVDLDRQIAGMSAGDLIIVAGRPSMGKTAFAMNVAEHVALTEKVPVGVFSMEMPGNQLATRLMASVAGLNQHRVRRGRLNSQEWTRLTNAVEQLESAPIHLDESSMLNPNELRSRARRLYRATKGKLGLIIVDYLQLMSGNNDRENRVNQIGEISRGMKLLAKELGIPVIALSQLNRELEKRPNKRPVMSDLRDGGGIEQDADVILFIYRDEVYHEDSRDKGIAEINVSKQRNGPIGTIRLTFRGDCTRFENLVRTGGQF